MNTPQKKTNDGWIKLFRQFLDWEWHDVPDTAYLFVILLLLVNHQDQRWHGQIIRRGQVLTSRDKLMAFTGLSARKIRTSLERLERTSEICLETTNQNTLITITNYDRYQGCGEGGRPATDQHATSIRPASDQQPTLNNKDNNDNNDNNDNESWRFRMKNCMEHDAAKVAQRQAAAKSRMDVFMDDIYNIHTYYDGERKTNPAPDEQ